MAERSVPYRVTREDILQIKADVAVISVEIAMNPAAEPVSRALTEAGGDTLRAAMRALRFLPIGSAAAVEPGRLPFSHVILTAAPRWLTGKANELLALHRCYESIFTLAKELGCGSVATPFLSAHYYRFPKEEAVHIALTEAEKSGVETVFAAATPELLTLSEKRYRKPEIVSYIGWYRDHAIFELDDGRYARVDLRPEIEDVALIPYFEACYRVGNNPLQPPLPEQELQRLRAIYERTEW